MSKITLGCVDLHDSAVALGDQRDGTVQWVDGCHDQTVTVTNKKQNQENGIEVHTQRKG